MNLMRVSAIFGIGMVAMASATLGPLAHAADLSPNYPPAPEITDPDAGIAPLGTGWYLRGDASAGPEARPKLTPFGFDTKQTEWGYGFGGGIGYKLDSLLRFDITGDYLQPFDYSAQSSARGTTTLTQGSLNRYDGLVNAYADLGTWYGVTPYVGAGLGFSRFDPSGSLSTTTAGTTTVQKSSAGDRTNFAWAAMVGFSYALTDKALIDIGYRHLDLGRFDTVLGAFAYHHSFTRDDVRFGIRYMID
jgi:opacity protein-like surface antigen